MTYSKHCSIAGLALFAAASLSAHGQAVWRTDWTMQATPTFQNYFAYLGSGLQEPYVFTPDGDLLMRTPTFSGEDDQIMRLSASGAVRWRVNLGTFGSMRQAGNSAMLGKADGSAVVVTQAGGSVVKIGADGSLQWSQLVAASSLASLGTGAVAVLDCTSLSALDLQTGQLLWTRQLSAQKNRCAGASLTGDTLGNVYATFSTYTVGQTGFDLYKFAADGALLWRSHDDAAQEMLLLGVSDTNVYVTPASPGNSNDPLRAYAITDGAPRWNVTGVYPLCIAGAPAEPIVFATADQAIVRLAAASGAPRWSHPQSYAAFYASSQGNLLLINRDALDASTGALQWTAALPSSDANGATGIGYFASGVASDGAVLYAGRSNDPSAQPVIQRVNAATGQVIGAFALGTVTQSPLFSSLRLDAQTIGGAAVVPSTSGRILHVRTLDADNGALRWETTQGFADYLGESSWTGISSAGTAVAVSVTFPDSSLWVGAFDKATGAQRWGTFLFYQFGSQLSAYDPIADASGDVLMSYAAHVFCPPNVNPSQVCTQLSVVKLDAANGSVVWQHDDVLPFRTFSLSTPPIALLGNDVVVGGKLTGQYATSTMLKLSGSDGSVLWSTDQYYAPNSENGSVVGIFPSDDGNVVVTGGGWGKFDGGSGALIWSNGSPTPTCYGFCYSSSWQATSDGSILFSGQDIHRASIEFWPAIAGATIRTWHPDYGDVNISTSAAMVDGFSGTHEAWLHVARRYGPEEAVYLVRFDTDTGNFLSQQALYLNSDDPLVAWQAPVPLSAPQNDRLLAFEFINQAPAPYSFANAMIDSTITANGNLALQASTSRDHARPGEQIDFQFSVTYSGDTPTNGARLLADFPWPGLATGVQCTPHSATNCRLDLRAGTIVADFDVQPGGGIDITGHMRTTDVVGYKVRALVAGPIGLNEANTFDNAASAVVDEVLFADGFE